MRVRRGIHRYIHIHEYIKNVSVNYLEISRCSGIQLRTNRGMRWFGGGEGSSHYRRRREDYKSSCSNRSGN